MQIRKGFTRLVTAAVTAAAAVAYLAPPAAAAPANDYFRSAQIVQGVSGSASGNNVGATREAGEPIIAGNAGGASIWYSWTAPATGSVDVYSQLYDGNTGSYLSNLVGVYTGSSLSNLTPVAASVGTTRSFGFAARAGTTYKIAIDGDKGVQGRTYLQWNLYPANDSFSNAETIEGSTGAVEGSNERTGKESSEPNHAGNAGGASIWYRWTAEANGEATIHTLGSSFDTLLGVYTGTSVSGLSEVSSNDDCGTDRYSCVTFDASAGTTYSIAIDGYNGATGGSVLEWSQVTDPCTIRGTSGNDTLTGTAGADVICGLGGNDTISGRGGDDTIDGGEGLDKVSYATAPAGVTVNLGTATAMGEGTDTLSEVEDVIGSAYADSIDGNAGANGISGGAGNDKVSGVAGNDIVGAGDGDDRVYLGLGDDRGVGGTGIDTIIFYDAAVSADLAIGRATGEGTDSFTGIENVTGSQWNDVLKGSSGANLIKGNAGADTLYGLDGADKLYGNAGVDGLQGGTGNDLLSGGPENDSVNGGAGTDQCLRDGGTDARSSCES